MAERVPRLLRAIGPPFKIVVAMILLLCFFLMPLEENENLQLTDKTTCALELGGSGFLCPLPFKCTSKGFGKFQPSAEMIGLKVCLEDRTLPRPPLSYRRDKTRQMLKCILHHCCTVSGGESVARMCRKNFGQRPIFNFFSLDQIYACSGEVHKFSAR